MSQTCDNHKHPKVGENPWPYTALWHLLDGNMANEFMRMQWEADLESPLQEWNDEGREQWWRWIEEEDGLCEVDCLRVLLWYRLWQQLKATQKTIQTM